MATKSTRYVDPQGRVIIPHHIREALNLQPGNHVAVALEDDGTIRIRASRNRCALCGNDIEPGEAAISTKKKGENVCMFCARTIADKVKED